MAGHPAEEVLVVGSLHVVADCTYKWVLAINGINCLYRAFGVWIIVIFSLLVVFVEAMAQ